MSFDFNNDFDMVEKEFMELEELEKELDQKFSYLDKVYYHGSLSLQVVYNSRDKEHILYCVIDGISVDPSKVLDKLRSYKYAFMGIVKLFVFASRIANELMFDGSDVEWCNNGFPFNYSWGMDDLYVNSEFLFVLFGDNVGIARIVNEQRFDLFVLLNKYDVFEEDKYVALYVNESRSYGLAEFEGARELIKKEMMVTVRGKTLIIKDDELRIGDSDYAGFVEKSFVLS